MCNRHPWDEPTGVLTCVEPGDEPHTHHYESTLDGGTEVEQP